MREVSVKRTPAGILFVGIYFYAADEVGDFARVGLEPNAVVARRRVRSDRHLKTYHRRRPAELRQTQACLVNCYERRVEDEATSGNQIQTLAGD